MGETGRILVGNVTITKSHESPHRPAIEMDTCSMEALAIAAKGFTGTVRLECPGVFLRIGGTTPTAKEYE